MYSQPYAFKFFATQSAVARKSVSFTPSPKASQLFHPIGGLGANPTSCARATLTAPLHTIASNKIPAAHHFIFPLICMHLCEYTRILSQSFSSAPSSFPLLRAGLYSTHEFWAKGVRP